MDTNSNIPEDKKVVDVQIMHLDDPGYGPHGRFTRQDWRDLCLEKLKSGTDAFNEWQKQCVAESAVEANLLPVSFTYKVIFQDETFEIFPVLGRSHPCTLDFIGQNISFKIAGAGMQFQFLALFSGAKLESNAVFDAATFYGWAFFKYTLFLGVTSFKDTKFANIANFDNAIFAQGVSFGGYEGAVFMGEAYFRNAYFIKDTSFSMARFKNAVDFLEVTFRSQTYFKHTFFFSSACFENGVFNNIVNFEEAIFVTEVPSFRGCQLDKTRLEFSSDTDFPISDFSDKAIKNISFLKRLSDEQGQTDQALIFNKFELVAKREQAKLTIEKLNFFSKVK